uniref:Uncharacterized protein n=1 Tax=Lepeophtheirus salmonis TaxID=72036 RepID=A0A0K2U8R7_LEPSM
MNFIRVIIVSPSWAQSNIGDQHRSNSCQFPCLFPSLLL